MKLSEYKTLYAVSALIINNMNILKTCKQLGMDRKKLKLLSIEFEERYGIKLTKIKDIDSE